MGLEVLDNMPHDRLWFDHSTGKLTEQTVVRIKKDSEGNEIGLEESKTPIDDPMCKLFVDIYESMPDMDHIAANKVLKNEGFFKRLQDIVISY